MRSLARHPLVWILAAAAGLRLAGLFWGLPAADGWDDDGFAPRNFLTALALTYKQGSYFTYPPLHAFLLALLTLPGIVIALLQVPSFHQADVIAEFTKPATMTFFAVTGRLVSLAMSLGIIWCAGEMARLVAGRRAGLFAAGACALNFSLTYYSQVSNLDVPYLFWAMLALLWSMRAAVEQHPRRFWAAALFAAAAVATKDQAYGLFLLNLPLFLLSWFAADRWPRAHARKIALTLLPAAAVALLALLLVDGAIVNPSGFLRRIAFLAGPASQDYAEYQHSPAGWLALLGDMGGYFGRAMALPAALAVLVGAHGARNQGGVLVVDCYRHWPLSLSHCASILPPCGDDRFFCRKRYWDGISVAARRWLSGRPWMRLAARGALTLTALFALHQCIAVNAAFLFDPRYDAETWMAAHVRTRDTIETYGQNCFLPRFPRAAAVARVGPGDPKLRNPLAGIIEVQASFGAPRDPRFIVVSAAWAWRYLRPGVSLSAGHIYSRLQQADFRNTDAQVYFRRLVSGRLNYRLAHAAHYDGLWPLVHIHDSLDEPIWIFERTS